jgi:hypothetical protein
VFPRLSSPLLELVGPIRSARASGVPYSGFATYLVFSTDTDSSFLRIFTSTLEYTPPKAEWDRMVATGKPITATLVGAVIEDDQMVEGGPFKGSSITIKIGASEP